MERLHRVIPGQDGDTHQHSGARTKIHHPQYGGDTRVDYCRFGFRGNRTRSRLLAVAREGRSKRGRSESQTECNRIRPLPGKRSRAISSSFCRHRRLRNRHRQHSSPGLPAVAGASAVPNGRSGLRRAARTGF